MIRPAQQTDLPRLTEIELRANGVFPPGRIPDVDDVIDLPDLEKATSQGLLFVFSAQECEADQVVGYAMCNVAENVLIPGDRVMHMAEVAVDPDFGRRGFGRQLVEYVVAESRRRNLSSTALTTFSDLPYNGPFYESLGFKVIPEGDLLPALAEILADERQQGMINRVAMKLDNHS